MGMKLAFTPDLLVEMAKGYDLAIRYLDQIFKPVRHEEVARYMINLAHFGVEDSSEMATMAIHYFNFTLRGYGHSIKTRHFNNSIKNRNVNNNESALRRTVFDR